MPRRRRFDFLRRWMAGVYEEPDNRRRRGEEPQPLFKTFGFAGKIVLGLEKTILAGTYAIAAGASFAFSNGISLGQSFTIGSGIALGTSFAFSSGIALSAPFNVGYGIGLDKGFSFGSAIGLDKAFAFGSAIAFDKGFTFASVIDAPTSFAKTFSFPYGIALTDDQLYFQAMTVQPSTARKTLLSALINGLKTDGIWAGLDLLAIHAMHDEQASRVNAKNPSMIAARGSGIAHTTDKGERGDGTSNGVLTWTGLTDSAATNHIASTTSANNRIMLGTWINENVATEDGTECGFNGNDTDYLQVRMADATSRARLNTTPDAISGGFASSAAAKGFHCVVRFQGNCSWWQNGASAAASVGNTSGVGSVANSVPGTFLTGGGGSTKPTSKKRMAVTVLGYVSGANNSLLYDRLNTYLTAISALS